MSTSERARNAQPQTSEPDNLRRISASLEWRGLYESVQRVRDHAFVVDEPEKLGGGDQGPTPLEYVVGAYDGCLQIVIAMVAREMRLELRAIEVSSVATVDRRGLFGTAPVSPHFQRIETEIALDVDGDDVAFERLTQAVLTRCPLYNLVKDAGVTQDLRWTRRPAPPASTIADRP